MQPDLVSHFAKQSAKSYETSTLWWYNRREQGTARQDSCVLFYQGAFPSYLSTLVSSYSHLEVTTGDKCQCCDIRFLLQFLQTAKKNMYVWCWFFCQTLEALPVVSRALLPSMGKISILIVTCPICHKIGHFLNSPSWFFSPLFFAYEVSRKRNEIAFCLAAGYQNSHLKRPVHVYAIIFYFSVSNKNWQLGPIWWRRRGLFSDWREQIESSSHLLHRWHSVNVRVRIKAMFFDWFQCVFVQNPHQIPSGRTVPTLRFFFFN